MNIASLSYVYKTSSFLAKSKKSISSATCIVSRCFSNSASQKSKSLFPLHEAVRLGDIKEVKQILKTSTLKVNGLNAQGELPLGIAAKEYLKRENYPSEILKVLHDYGACYLLQDKQGEAPLCNIEKKNFTKNITDISWQVKMDATIHSLSGCGLPLKECTNSIKSESKVYPEEFKAKIALESLSTSLTVDELSRKYSIEPCQVIKWRWQAREGLVELFKDKK